MHTAWYFACTFVQGFSVSFELGMSVLLKIMTFETQGVKRTKLGLREFIQLGTMLQEIDMERKHAVGVYLA